MYLQLPRHMSEQPGAFQKAIQDEPKMFSRGKAQLVLIALNIVSITSSALALKLLVAPLLLLLEPFTYLHFPPGSVLSEEHLMTCAEEPELKGGSSPLKSRTSMIAEKCLLK